MSEPVRATSYLLYVSAATDVGRERETNEDAHVVASLGSPSAAPLEPGKEVAFNPTERPVLLAVSDGMGGAAAGEIASALVVEALRRSLPSGSPDWETTLRDAVEEGELQGMGGGAASIPARDGRDTHGGVRARS